MVIVPLRCYKTISPPCRTTIHVEVSTWTRTPDGGRHNSLRFSFHPKQCPPPEYKVKHPAKCMALRVCSLPRGHQSTMYSGICQPLIG